jgi:hypothetical protein
LGFARFSQRAFFLGFYLMCLLLHAKKRGAGLEAQRHSTMMNIPRRTFDPGGGER